jgi:hypothetical protein
MVGALLCEASMSERRWCPYPHAVGNADRRVQDEAVARSQTGADIDRAAVIGGNIEMPQPRHAILVHGRLQAVPVEDERL